MPQLQTKYFGPMAYKEESVFEFPFGIPGFEQEQHFVFVETPEYTPVVFLQSLRQPSLCFLAMPVLAIDPTYCLAVTVEDRAELGLDVLHDPKPGDGVLALALVSLHDGFSPTANLMAPIVVNVELRRALQAIRIDRTYSHQHPVSVPAHREGVC